MYTLASKYERNPLKLSGDTPNGVIHMYATQILPKSSSYFTVNPNICEHHLKSVGDKQRKWSTQVCTLSPKSKLYPCMFH